MVYSARILGRFLLSALQVISGGGVPKVQLYYFHDPMCSWCWGYSDTFNRLKNKLPANVQLCYVVGGLAPDTDEAMPIEMQQALQMTWRKIERRLGVKFNYDFWRVCSPRRSTYLACRAVLAAGKQGRYLEMITAIQQAYYRCAKNPSDLSVLIDLGRELKLDVMKFESDMQSQAVERQLKEEVAMARAWPISGFPSWVLEVGGERYPVELDYVDEERTLVHIQQLLGGEAGDRACQF